MRYFLPISHFRNNYLTQCSPFYSQELLLSTLLSSFEVKSIMRGGKPQSFSCRALVYFLKFLLVFDHHVVDSPLPLIATLRKTLLKHSRLETEPERDLGVQPSSSCRLLIQLMSCWGTSRPRVSCRISLQLFLFY